MERKDPEQINENKNSQTNADRENQGQASSCSWNQTTSGSKLNARDGMFHISGGPKTLEQCLNRLGCVLPFAFLLLVIVVVLILLGRVGVSIGPKIGEEQHKVEITESTQERTPLETDGQALTEYYTDEANLLVKDVELIQGMTDFYQQTGIKPYLYITDRLSYPQSETDMTVYTELYDSLFADQEHMLVVYFCSAEPAILCVVGTEAREAVFDHEAENIFYDYFTLYSGDEQLTIDEALGAVFSDTADRIMKKQHSTSLYAWILVGVILVIYTLVNIRKRSAAKKAYEAAQNVEGNPGNDQTEER